ncbi:DNA-directed DNA polymerase [Handroanthus impetiginosus]|uniref:DNA-directed DNA polymerase n=1 Tax=Handroanthus impetiginosus TaxID=429701 RepID=A0A2G9HD94_9LAMI|nr:DNA-directed DNA polymerase [Handroanthus impetiginosus]
MAKNQVAAGRTRNKNKSKTENKSKSTGKTSTAVNTKSKNKGRNKINKTANDDASGEETKVLAVPSSSTESQKEDVVESSEAEEEDGVEEQSPTDEDEKEAKRQSKRIKKKSRKEDVKSKGKKRSKNEDDEEEAEEKSENALYRFPMNRISRIIRSDNPDIRISQEAVFLINRASEKFLQVFSREAYACAFIDQKNYTAYNHLSSVVSKRKRFAFLSDFVPEKVKAEDALAQISASEK